MRKIAQSGRDLPKGFSGGKRFSRADYIEGRFHMGKVAGHIYSPLFAANYKKIRKLIRRIYNIKKIRFLELNVLNLQSKV